MGRARNGTAEAGGMRDSAGVSGMGGARNSATEEREARVGLAMGGSVEQAARDGTHRVGTWQQQSGVGRAASGQTPTSIHYRSR